MVKVKPDCVGHLVRGGKVRAWIYTQGEREEDGGTRTQKEALLLTAPGAPEKVKNTSGWLLVDMWLNACNSIVE